MPAPRTASAVRRAPDSARCVRSPCVPPGCACESIGSSSRFCGFRKGSCGLGSRLRRPRQFLGVNGIETGAGTRLHEIFFCAVPESAYFSESHTAKEPAAARAESEVLGTKSFELGTAIFPRRTSHARQGFFVLRSECSGLGSQHLVLGTQYSVLGAKCEGRLRDYQAGVNCRVTGSPLVRG